MTVVVRTARPEDVAAIHARLMGFGRHVGNPDWVSTTEDQLGDALFGPASRGFAYIAVVDGRIAGVALWFLTYNFWMAQPILYLEDLFVDAEARGAGAGEALMRALAGEATAGGGAWMAWKELTDNVGG